MTQALAWDIVRRAAQGDANARRDLVEATIDDLWRLAMRLTRREDDADDVVQETYTRIFEVLDVHEEVPERAEASVLPRV